MERSILYIGIGAAVLMSLAATVYYFQVKSNSIPVYVSGQKADYRSTIPFWENQIRTDGGSRAYENFAIAVQNISDGAKHSYAHMFGEALYNVEGPEGFGMCDTRYQSGCYHQFLGMAFAQLGLSSVKGFAIQCAEKESKRIPGCSHGMGHAVLSLVGYTREDLTKALSICDEDFAFLFGWKGCVDGAIMEYNIRDVSSGGTEDISNARLLTTENRYTPCLSLPDTYQPTCVHELPRWWSLSLFSQSTHPADVASTLGTWCQEFTGTLYTSCIQSIGYILSGKNDVTTLVGLCDDATHDRPSQLACLYGGARRYYMDYPKKELLCARFQLSADESSSCESYATFADQP